MLPVSPSQMHGLNNGEVHPAKFISERLVFVTGGDYGQVGGLSAPVSIPCSSKHLESLILCFLVFAASPSDKLAVRIVVVKGDITVMSKTTCLPLSQLRTRISAGWV